MKIINSTNGSYLTEVQESFADAESLAAIFKDYVVPRRLRACLDMCSTSTLTLNDERAIMSPYPRVENGVFFLCNSSDEKVGAITFTFSDHGNVNNTYLTEVKAVIKLSEREKGYFSQLFLLFSWYTNQFLRCDRAQVGVVNTAPQVARKLDERAVSDIETINTANSSVPYDSVVEKGIQITEYANSFTSGEWSTISLEVAGTSIVVPTKGVAGF